MLSDVGDLARMRYGVRKLAELVQQPAIVGITDMDDEAPMLMGRDPSADGSTSNAAFPSRMPPAEVLAMSDDELDAWMVFNCGDGIHTTGSCRMGSPDDPRSVVDSDGRVLGLQGLRVADASIMPDVRAITFCLCPRAALINRMVVAIRCVQIVRANTHLSSIVIGENVAAKIIAERVQQTADATATARL